MIRFMSLLVLSAFLASCGVRGDPEPPPGGDKVIPKLEPIRRGDDTTRTTPDADQ